ncbi:N-formylglutamate amidohydrolase [Gluconobacter sp. LMG 31484]|uniref:N-formylglutamate amidohydrolase n=1 Tax=Gluconobacter vitians TaxID=2728102 RepID=A0ABR9Y1P2_9PROT|nr:N-formylglutamate amidohydrolase [Gluconobacter vitians]MBF0857869.1 N-formylglutamate amidohydrolase [Gluconobacter vitians]
MSAPLLGAHDPAPFLLFPEKTPSPFVFVSDHAGRAVPDALGDMGVQSEDWERHIAWDIGIVGVGRILHERLGSALIEQVYSRLVIDCNRAPGHPTSMPLMSDGTPVPANQAAQATCRARREQEILHPYHDTIAEVLVERGPRPTALIALHSFTPQMNGQDRPWQIGILHNQDSRMAAIALDLLREDTSLCVGDNEPYVLTDTSDYTVPRHAEAAGLPYLEIEIRQDLIVEKAGQRDWAERLATLLPKVWARLTEGAGA